METNVYCKLANEIKVFNTEFESECTQSGIDLIYPKTKDFNNYYNKQISAFILKLIGTEPYKNTDIPGAFVLVDMNPVKFYTYLRANGNWDRYEELREKIFNNPQKYNNIHLQEDLK